MGTILKIILNAIYPPKVGKINPITNIMFHCFILIAILMVTIMITLV